MKTFPRVPVALLLALVLLIPCRSSQAQTGAPRLQPDSSIRPRRPPHYWRNFAAGFGTSILAHEAGHVGASLLLGGHPTFGFDRGRPTVYSGFTAALEPRKQFVFSSMGLNVQAALDETILDVPHNGGGPFERGVLASGIATALFYIDRKSVV